MTILFEDTLRQFFAHLGLSYPENVGMDDYPVLALDDQMLIQFVERNGRVEIVASLGTLPDNKEMLRNLLISNYSALDYPISFASDADGNDLLAIIRLPLDISHEILLAALQSLVMQIEASKTLFEESISTDKMAEKLMISVR